MLSHDKNEKNTIKQVLPVSLIHDHSIIDGVGVAEFLQILQEKVNQPDCLWR